jgi:enoyl-CoA hydratase/carnithine racemase
MENVYVSHGDGISHAVFNRPMRKNSLTNEMYEALIGAIDAAAHCPDTKVLLLSRADGVFTAGHDLDGFIERPPQSINAPAFRFLSALARFEKPVVAAVEGVAIRIGATMLMHCDLVYAAEDARFAMPFVNLGLVPEGASSLLLPRLCGHHRAAEVLFQ